MITVKDIREKEFSQQKHGYHEDEVDEFLDEIADQMEALIRENRTMMKKLEEAQASPAQTEPAPNQSSAVPMPASPRSSAPEAALADDSVYFRNLEATLRETLISAQRIADQTVGEAKKKAEQTMQEAQAKAEALKREAASESATLRATLAQDTQNARAQLDQVRGALEEHKKKFRAMLEAQMEVLGDGEKT